MELLINVVQLSMNGIVYALTNEAMPGLVKVGRTARPMRERLAQYNAYIRFSDDFPLFRYEFHARSRNCIRDEEKVLFALSAFAVRCGTSREMFKVETTAVRSIFERIVGDVTDSEFRDWPWDKTERLGGGWGKTRRWRGGFQVYDWLRKNHDEVVTRLCDPAFSWEQLSYEIGLKVGREGAAFTPLHPSVVRAIWHQAHDSHMAFGQWPSGDRNHGTPQSG